MRYYFCKKENNIWDLKQYPKVNGGIVVIDPFTGDVKALVGGFNFKSSEFNRVTQAKRQPGSAFKPICLCSSFRKWILTKFNSIRCSFCRKPRCGIKRLETRKLWKKFYGPSTLRKGIEYSRNLMTVRIAKTIRIK